MINLDILALYERFGTKDLIGKQVEVRYTGNLPIYGGDIKNSECFRITNIELGDIDGEYEDCIYVVNDTAKIPINWGVHPKEIFPIKD